METPSQQARSIVAVMGGTGIQGEGAIEYLLDQGGGAASCRIRTLTRNASSPKALALSARGIEVIQGPNSVESWKRLMDGAESLFALTFTDFEDPNGELRRGKQLFNVILQSPSLQQVVFSGGERTAIESLNAKADIEAYARNEIEKQASQKQTTARGSIQFTFLHTSFFYENLVSKNNQKRYRRTDSGRFVFTLPLEPGKEISMISARDIGRIAAHILWTTRPFAGTKSFTIVGDLVSPHRFLASLRNALPNYQFEYNQTDFEVLSQRMGHAQAKLVMEMYDTYYQKGSDKEATNTQIASTKALYSNVMSLEAWTSLYVAPILQQEAE